MFTMCSLYFAARETGKVSGCQVHTHQKHQGMVLGPLLASKPLRCGKLPLFFFRSQLYLLDVWCLPFWRSRCVNHWLQIEFCFTRTSYARLLLRINLGELSVTSSTLLCIYSSVMMQFCSFDGGMFSFRLYMRLQILN